MANIFVDNALTRVTSQWWNRLLGAAKEGDLAGQDEMYASHRTTRDYVCNSIGIATWGMVFPILTIVVTQLVGAELAGMFSLAFVTGMLLMIVANYGVRTFQVSDIDEEHSFADYQVNRYITCVVMVALGVLYCMVRGYSGQMFIMSIGVYIYKMVDGLADVYEGRLQQMDKFYLAGISQAVRSVAVLAIFSLVLFVTRDLGISAIAMALVSAVSFVFITFPLALLETPKSAKWTPEGVKALFKQCGPLFVALFLYSLIDNMPKFVMEGVLSYDNQLYFNALYFPAQGILLTVQLIYKPLLVRLAGEWADPTRRKRFDVAIVAMMGVVVAITAVMCLFMGTIGIPLMSLLYGLDFEQFRNLSYIMVVAGGVTAAIDFLYQVITVLRRQASVTKLYLITFAFSIFVPILLINFTGLPGAIIGYLIVMCILLSLLVMEYITIRLQFNAGAIWDGGEEARSRDALPMNPALSGRIDISQADALRARKTAVKTKHNAARRVQTGKTSVSRTRKPANVSQTTHAHAPNHAKHTNVATSNREAEAARRERERKARERAQLVEQSKQSKQRKTQLREYEADTQALSGRRSSAGSGSSRNTKPASARGKHSK